jgi:bifunctional UDP-N-acetylglucosamine pyrophosphorylase / glucosamine-1-phosphate N-acetyltransferase
VSSSGPAAVLILAAGDGTRMRSAVPKMLNEVCGRAMLGHVLAAVGELDADQVIVVISEADGPVARYTAQQCPRAKLVVQERNGSWGTGHAVRSVIESVGVIHGTVLVVFSDTPMLRGSTLADLAAKHRSSAAAVTVLTTIAPDPTGYGRIIRDGSGLVDDIVEERDATAEQRAVTEISSGMFAFDGDLLADAIKRVPSTNASGEEYLTAVPGILRADGHLVGSALCADFDEVQGVNNQAQLARARRVLNARLVERCMAAGVTVVDPASTWIDVGVTAEPGATIGPNSQLEGQTAIGAGASVGPGCLLRDTHVGAGATVLQSVCESVTIDPGTTVGPFAHLAGSGAARDRGPAMATGVSPGQQSAPRDSTAV